MNTKNTKLWTLVAVVAGVGLMAMVVQLDHQASHAYYLRQDQDHGALEDGDEFLMDHGYSCATPTYCIRRPSGVYTCRVSCTGGPPAGDHTAVDCQPRDWDVSNVDGSRCQWHLTEPQHGN